MSTSLADYMVKLLDKVQGNEELNVILNEHQPDDDNSQILARLQLAIDFKEKKASRQNIVHTELYNVMTENFETTRIYRCRNTYGMLSISSS